MVVVTGAGIQDENGAAFVLSHMQGLFTRLKVVFGDSAYGRQELPEWVRETFGWILQTVLRPVRAQGFVVLPKRWIVERTFAWLVRYPGQSHIGFVIALSVAPGVSRPNLVDAD